MLVLVCMCRWFVCVITRRRDRRDTSPICHDSHVCTSRSWQRWHCACALCVVCCVFVGKEFLLKCGASDDRCLGFSFVRWLFGGSMVCWWLCLCHCFCRSWRCQAFLAASVYLCGAVVEATVLTQQQHWRIATLAHALLVVLLHVCERSEDCMRCCHGKLHLLAATRVYCVGVWFGFVRFALLLAVALC